MRCFFIFRFSLVYPHIKLSPLSHVFCRFFYFLACLMLRWVLLKLLERCWLFCLKTVYCLLKATCLKIPSWGVFIVKLNYYFPWLKANFPVKCWPKIFFGVSRFLCFLSCGDSIESSKLILDIPSLSPRNSPTTRWQPVRRKEMLNTERRSEVQVAPLSDLTESTSKRIIINKICSIKYTNALRNA